MPCDALLTNLLHYILREFVVLQKEDLTAGLKKKSGYTVVFQYMRSKISMSELLTVDNKNLIN